MEENFQQGVAALKAGDRAAARRLLGAVVRQSPDHIQAWLWLAGAVDKDEERVFCLRQVLRIHPDHPAAARAMSQLLQKQAKSQPVAQNPPAPQNSTVPEPGPASLVKVPSLPETPPQVSEAVETPPAVRHNISPVKPSSHPNLRFLKTAADDSSGRRIFRSRPSLAPTLIGFWIMFFIAWGLNGVLQESTQVELTLSLLNCSILGGIIAYLLIRLMLTHYELTSRQIILSSRGKHTVIPIQHILNIVLEQNWFQKIIRTADIVIEASIAGELRQVRMRNQSNFQTKKDQMMYLVQEQE